MPVGAHETPERRHSSTLLRGRPLSEETVSTRDASWHDARLLEYCSGGTCGLRWVREGLGLRFISMLWTGYLATLVVALTLSTSSFAQTLQVPITSPSSKWEAAIKAFEAADKTNPPPQGALLFVG